MSTSRVIMNIRKITSLTMLISFVLCIMTSIILYVMPHGRVAYWSHWHFWGLSKNQWGELHLNLGLLLLLAGFLHVYFNWQPVTAYLKNKSKQIKVFTVNFNIAMLLTLIVGTGTFLVHPALGYLRKKLKRKSGHVISNIRSTTNYCSGN